MNACKVAHLPDLVVAEAILKFVTHDLVAALRVFEEGIPIRGNAQAQSEAHVGIR